MNLMRPLMLTLALIIASPFVTASNHQAAGQLTEGEVRKVDKDAKKITIKHGPIVNLDMPAMSMVFQVKDPAMLEQVKAGDKIRFAADKLGGAYTIMKIEPVKQP